MKKKSASGLALIIGFNDGLSENGHSGPAIGTFGFFSQEYIFIVRWPWVAMAVICGYRMFPDGQIVTDYYYLYKIR